MVKISNRKLILISFLILFLDQIIKQLVRVKNVQTTGHFFDVTYTTNTGSLFSLFAGSMYVNLIFIVVSLLALVAMFYLIKKEKDSLQKISFGIISAGIFGNLIDRIFFGSVIDWANFHFWPIFNIADSALVVGVIIAIISLVKEEYAKKR